MVVEVAVAPVTVRGRCSEPQAGDGVTVYWVIGDPADAGSVQLTVTVSLELPRADTVGGRVGHVGRGDGRRGADGSLVPAALVAVTVKM